jgi:hypothetical protein
MIVWREKLVAFAIHFAVTLAVGLMAAALIFFVWFPDPFQDMVGGSKLFMLVVGCDLALGPLISLVIYNSRKSRRELYLDYSLVGIVQLGALIFGMFIAFNARPIYVVFVKDRLEVITANEIEDEDLKAATLPEFRTRPLWGPKLVATYVKPEDNEDALFQGLAGKDISLRPKFFVPYDAQLEQISAKLQPLAKLKQRHPTAEQLIADRVGSDAKSVESAAWLPVKHKRGFWTALFTGHDVRPTDYLPLDPY